MKLNKVLEHHNLLAFQSHNGTFCSLVQVPRVAVILAISKEMPEQLDGFRKC